MKFLKALFRTLFWSTPYGVKVRKYDCPCGSKIEVAFYSGSSSAGNCEKCGGRLIIN